MQPIEVDGAIAKIERNICERPAQGFLPHESVEGIDVLYHALVFTEATDALSAWRAALWERTLTEQGRAALAGMLDYLNREVKAGRGESVSGVCDCLATIFYADSDGKREPVAPAGER